MKDKFIFCTCDGTPEESKGEIVRTGSLKRIFFGAFLSYGFIYLLMRKDLLDKWNDEYNIYYILFVIETILVVIDLIYYYQGKNALTSSVLNIFYFLILIIIIIIVRPQGFMGDFKVALIMLFIVILICGCVIWLIIK